MCGRIIRIMTVKYNLPSQDKNADLYKTLAVSYGLANDLEENNRNYIVETLSKLRLNPKNSLLELGCGNGRLTGKIKQAFGEKMSVTAVDYSREMIDKAAEDVDGVAYINDTIDNFLDDSTAKKIQFDIVVIANTLHNLSSREEIFKILKKSSGILRPGGYLLFDIRNAHNPLVRRGYARNAKRGLQFHALSVGAIKKSFKNSGLKLIKGIPIHYSNMGQAIEIKGDRSFGYKLLYSIYMKLTRNLLFAPYILIVSQKKNQSSVPHL